MMLRNTIVASAVGLALAACGTNSPAPEATTDALAGDAVASDATPSGATAAPSAPAISAADFVGAAAASDTFEIDSSKLALTMAKDTDVTDFARMMIKDHAKSTAALKSAAAESTPAVKVAPALTAEQNDDLAKLKRAGAGFETLYGRLQVAGHEKALAAMRAYAASGESPPLKAFAATTSITVAAHLDKARALPQ